jgi:hypothetical protein
MGIFAQKECYGDIEKQKRCHDKMNKMLAGYKNYLITHKIKSVNLPALSKMPSPSAGLGILLN